MTDFPAPLNTYPAAQPTLLATLADRIELHPFNLVATTIFALAILHTFVAPQLVKWAHRLQQRHDLASEAAGRSSSSSAAAGVIHFAGEVEVIFGLWAVVLVAAATVVEGWEPARYYLTTVVNYTEPLFVVVIMALASTRPIVGLAERALHLVARAGRSTPLAWWLAILTIGPLLGSLITEPAAMTICALLLARQFYDLQPSTALKYATLGLLFVNVSIGGTLTHFAAPPVLMVARTWGWDTPFMLEHFGWRAILAIAFSNLLYVLLFHREFVALRKRLPMLDGETSDRQVARGITDLQPVPLWLAAVHVAFMAWTVVNAHYPALFIGGFVIFLGVARATAKYQGGVPLRGPILVGVFLAGLVIHGGLQGWWIAPLLASLREEPLFLGATVLTAFNDNALVTYLATLVPEFTEPLKIAVVGGAVTGGGLTVIANAPNPAGQSILSRFFDEGVSPGKLLLSALVPTLIAMAMFRAL